MRTSFIKFLEGLDDKKWDKVVIPVIQRDYAHGRSDAKATSIRCEIISAFLRAIRSNEEKPLILDYIYGMLSDRVFIPYDGQQRLTTLFLFYRYLSEACGAFDKVKDKLVKFSYETRSTARDFCKALCDKNILCDKSLIKIEDQCWFLPEWKNDPTIMGMIEVLEEIHRQWVEVAQIEDVPDKLIELMDERIQFNTLDMGTYHLDDTSYITMNARFLSLTPWENFKASFQQWLEKQSIDVKNAYNFLGPSYQKLDTDWLNLFYRDDEEKYDKNMMDMAHFHLSVFADGNEGEKNYDRPGTGFVPFSEYEKTLDHNPTVLVSLFRIWDYLSRNSNDGMKSLFAMWKRKGNEEKKIKAIIDLKGTHTKRLVYYASALYVKKNHNDKFDQKEEVASLGDWMRIVWNILEHANVDLKDFPKAKKNLKELLKDYLSNKFGEDKQDEAIWKEPIKEERMKYRFLQNANDGDKERLYDLESDAWIHGRLKTYRYDFNSVDDSVLKELEERKAWLKNLRTKCYRNNNASTTRYMIINAILTGDGGKLSNNIAFSWGEDDQEWISEFKKSNWDHVWDKIYKEYPNNYEEEESLENWPKEKLALLRGVLKKRQTAYVQLASYNGTPYVKTKPNSNIATSYLLDFAHAIAFSHSGEKEASLKPNQYYPIERIKKDGRYLLRINNASEPIVVEEAVVEAWKLNVDSLWVKEGEDG